MPSVSTTYIPIYICTIPSFGRDPVFLSGFITFIHGIILLLILLLLTLCISFMIVASVATTLTILSQINHYVFLSLCLSVTIICRSSKLLPQSRSKNDCCPFCLAALMSSSNCLVSPSRGPHSFKSIFCSP